MKDCNCNRSNQGRAICPTPERCDAEEMHMVEPNVVRYWIEHSNQLLTLISLAIAAGVLVGVFIA
jgi:hypothetical protein